jgi:hypothetical protein
MDEKPSKDLVAGTLEDLSWAPNERVSSLENEMAAWGYRNFKHRYSKSTRAQRHRQKRITWAALS